MFSDPQKNIEQFGLAPGSKVADLGSGSGFYSLALAKRLGEQGRVFAVDTSKDMLQRLKNDAKRFKFYNIETLWGDIEKLGGTKLAGGAVDSAVVANTLFFLENKGGFMNELKRILKSGGRVLVVDWKDSYGGIGPQREHVFTLPQAKDLFEKNGFSFEREISAGSHHYGIIFKKLN